MTEAEWLGCTDNRVLLGFLSGKGSKRKKRLFACGCFRSLGSALEGGLVLLQKAVQLAEELAEGSMIQLQAETLLRSLSECHLYSSSNVLDPLAIGESLICPDDKVDTVAQNAAYFSLCIALHRKLSWRRANVCDLLRCIFGNPFRPVAVGPSWLTWNDGTVVKIAQAIYYDRAFDRLPVLADALEEAGCHEPDILAHCRQPGEHVRGCWGVDLILGKE
jgi:hypothetical protein